jgi:rubrerythrin
MFADIVRFAIEQEQAAAELYERTAARSESRSARMLLEEMAGMERGHEARLKALMATGQATFPKPGEIKDLRIGDFLVAESLRADSPVDLVFVFAIKAEQKAHELYSRMADAVSDATTRELLDSLSEEELRHKHDLELQYEKGFMKDN